VLTSLSDLGREQSAMLQPGGETKRSEDDMGVLRVRALM
jgi:hypothetical protein